jgi:tetratricopeptide (TPR) repeat protein
MEARAWASDRSSALKAFARYETRLAEELGAKPGADLVRMADLLRDGRRAPRPAVAGYPPPRVDRRFEPETLIGREREFSVLYDAWLEARRKNPRIVVVTGDPGVGKTTLVNAFASTCQMDGAVVARAQAYEAEKELPFAVLGELVKQLATQRAIGSADPEALSELTRVSSDIVAVFPGVPKPLEWSPELMPLRIADALLKTVSAAAADSPVLLVVDDIHAADNASTAILHSVARKWTDTRVLLILAGRPSELRLSKGAWALTSDTSEYVRALELEILSAQAAERLMRRLALGANDEPPVERILKAAGGNPLAIELLTREWAEHGAASLLHDLEAMDRQPVATIGIPRAIGVVFDRQSRRLAPEIRATLDLGAVLGRRLTEVQLYAAIDLPPGQAAEALSRLREEGYLREVTGTLEFRNELIRAQAYYSVAGATRQHLHREVAELLSRDGCEDKAISLEIAWHHLRGGDIGKAFPFAIEGAEAVLSVGAPHEAEEILGTLFELGPQMRENTRLLLLFAKALIDQSKADRAVPLIERLATDSSLSLHDQAEVARMRAAAEFSLSGGLGPRYCDAAKLALNAARQTADAQLIAQALFECARAGTEEGAIDLVQAAEEGVDNLATEVPLDAIPMAMLTKAFCKFFLGDPKEALRRLQRLFEISRHRANPAQLALIHSGLGIASYFLGRLEEACAEYVAALEITRKIGDDSRTCIMASNLCTLFMSLGDYESAVRYGKMSVKHGESCSSSSLLVAYTNLIDPYILMGEERAAVECLEKATSWIRPQRRWKLRLQFLLEAASFAIIRGNIALAMELIAQLEVVSRDREIALPSPGAYWKLKAFRLAQLGQDEAAYDLVCSWASRWKGNYVFPYLDVIATKAWLERRREGIEKVETSRELDIFEELKVVGKRHLLVLQGFLQPLPESETGMPGPHRA